MNSATAHHCSKFSSFLQILWKQKMLLISTTGSNVMMGGQEGHTEGALGTAEKEGTRMELAHPSIPNPLHLPRNSSSSNSGESRAAAATVHGAGLATESLLLQEGKCHLLFVP